MDIITTFPHIALEATPSTNLYLSQLCQREGERVLPFTTVSANYQSAGKGQRGNSWESEAGKNLLFSFVTYPTHLKARQQFLISQMVSLTIQETLSQWSDEITIKWPNDIYWREKKICGILIENDLNGSQIARSISGIGLNINQTRFVSDAPNPISLRQITGQEHDRLAILEEVMQRMMTAFRQAETEDYESYSETIANRYQRVLFRREGYHSYVDAQGSFMARLLRVESDGRFVLEDEQGAVREYLFKEVQYLL